MSVAMTDHDHDMAIDACAREKMEVDPELSEDDAWILATVEQNAYRDTYHKEYDEAFRLKRSELVRELVSEGTELAEALEEVKEEARDYAKEVAEEAATEASDEALEEARKNLLS